MLVEVFEATEILAPKERLRPWPFRTPRSPSEPLGTPWNPHTKFLTQTTVLDGNLGYQSMSDHYGRPCTYLPPAPPTFTWKNDFYFKMS